MIPTMRSLGSAADGVLKSVPEGVSRGEITAGLYGLGFLGRWALPVLKERGIRLVSGYDANMKLKGGVVEGLPIYAVGDLESVRPEFMFVAARHAVQSVSAMLSCLGIAHASCDALLAASNFSAFRDIHDHLLRDERSKEVLRSVLMTMLTGEKRFCADVFEKDQYFCLPQFIGSGNEIYVDAGAFVGDSAERFIWAQNGMFLKIYAFEPGRPQFSALKARTRRLVEEWALDPASIELVNAGLAEKDFKVSARSANGQLTSFAISSDSGTSSTTVDVVSLDSFLKGERITFLKADVEGMEMALLKGAQSTIRRHKPKISICVYHYPTDIPDIANYLADLVPVYHFALRHHAPQLMETVLYCWPD